MSCTTKIKPLKRCLWGDANFLPHHVPHPSHTQGTGVWPRCGQDRGTGCPQGPVSWGGELWPQSIGDQGSVEGPGLQGSSLFSQVGEQRPRDGDGLADSLAVTDRAGKRGKVLLVPSLPTLLLFTLFWGHDGLRTGDTPSFQPNGTRASRTCQQSRGGANGTVESCTTPISHVVTAGTVGPEAQTI